MSVVTGAAASHSTLTVNCISSLTKSPEQCCKAHLSITESSLYKCPLLLLLLLLCTVNF